ncbi:MAG: hypothetical protein MK008_06800 [Bdellovibrionales bacterium]|nr:hypothetical protein [Bdellovibrionales bacterium]
MSLQAAKQSVFIGSSGYKIAKKILMKFYIWPFFILLVACSSDKGTPKVPSSQIPADEALVTEADYQPIEDGLDIIAPEKNEPKMDQFQLIAEKHIYNFPVYSYGDPKNYEKFLIESFRKAKDDLDNLYTMNDEAIDSQIMVRSFEELMTLRTYISTRYLTELKKLSSAFIEKFYIYKRLYASYLLNVKVFDPELLSICSKKRDDMLVTEGFEGVEDEVELELDALDSVNKRSLNEFWGDTVFIDSSGYKTITISEALLITKKLEHLRETIYEYTQCKDNILAAQKLYQYLLTSNLSVFKTKHLSRDPEKAEDQASLISEYVDNLLTLVSDKDYTQDYHLKLAKQYSLIFEANMHIYGPWVEKHMIEENLKPKIYIPMAEKFLESSKKSEKDFYKGIRCNMAHYNHFVIEHNDGVRKTPPLMIPLSVDNCH